MEFKWNKPASLPKDKSEVLVRYESYKNKYRHMVVLFVKDMRKFDKLSFCEKEYSRPGFVDYAGDGEWYEIKPTDWAYIPKTEMEDNNG